MTIDIRSAQSLPVYYSNLEVSNKLLNNRYNLAEVEGRISF